jgi:beta-glucosidase
MTEATTVGAARTAWTAGLDVVFQGGRREAGPYLDAVRRALIPDVVLDAAVRRVLRVKFELGLFEQPYVDPDSAVYWNDHRDHRSLALRAARASMVLLRNVGGALPLSGQVRTIAVIGRDATERRAGGYSGSNETYVSLLDGIRERAGTTATVRFAAGPGRSGRTVVAVPAASLVAVTAQGLQTGLRGEYYDNIALAGQPVHTRIDPGVDFTWTLGRPAPTLGNDWYSVRWTGELIAPLGLTRLGVEGTDGFRLFVDDTLRLDRWRKESAGEHLVPVQFAPGSRHRIRLEFHESRGNARVRLVWDAGASPDWRERVDEAVALARMSDVAIVVAGIEEGEFRDRASLALPGQQEELIRAVAATGKPTIVVLVGGSAVTMTRWVDSVAAVVNVWYPGEEGGRALAEVLWGDFNPAGRLPITYPLAEGQLPLVYNHRPTGRGDDYLDLPGAPLFPFGHGLSYSTFEYSSLRMSPASIRADGTVQIVCRVRNAGSRAGDEVVQLYVRDELASTVRPVLQLAGFRRVTLQPGESVDVSFSVGPDQLRMVDGRGRWVVEPGTFRVLIGGSSTDIRLKGAFTVQ